MSHGVFEIAGAGRPHCSICEILFDPRRDPPVDLICRDCRADRKSRTPELFGDTPF